MKGFDMTEREALDLCANLAHQGYHATVRKVARKDQWQVIVYAKR